MKKRILSCFMALALCLTLLPATALAAEGESSTEPHTHSNWLTSGYGAKGSLTLYHNEADKISGDSVDQDDDGNWLLNGGNYYLRTDVENYREFSEVKIDHTIVIKGNVTICLNGQTLESIGENMPVFRVKAGGTLTLTDCKGNAGKVKHTSDGSGSGVKVESGGTFNMYGGTITKNTATDTYGGGVYVVDGTFTMNGGTITDNTATNGGGGVYVSGGTFTMNGNASVTNNRANGKNGISGGVYVVDGTFTMNGGTITKNTASSTDGGVGVYRSGKPAKFEMNGGAITKNTAKNGGGVGVYGTGSAFIMNGGTISGNKADQGNGGGVYMDDKGVHMDGATFTMNYSASVTGNTAKNGGGVYVESGTFDMNDGTITGNTAKNEKASNDINGGGVYVSNNGTFNMNDGAISGNKATNSDERNTTYGGGVYVSGGTFTMNGGASSVSKNTAKNGGGVYVSSGTFNMNDGKISGNTGNGVFVHNSATFTVSNTPTVTGNTITKNGAASNVYLMGSAYITIGNQGLNCSDGSIGVTKFPDLAPPEIVIAEGVNTNYSSKFFSDDETREVKYDETNNKLVLKKKETQQPEHEHKWTYRADKATITATCTGEGNCNVKDSFVRITPPDDLIYNGTEKHATVERSENWKPAFPENIVISYYKLAGGSYVKMVDEAPTKVGKYKASITVGDKDASVEYEITKGSTPAKQDQQPLKLTVSKDTIAVGETLKLTVEGGSTGGAVTYQLTSDGKGKAKIESNVLTAEQAGKVTVTATMAGNETHNDVTSNAITITITEPEKPDPKPEPKPEPSQPSNPGGGSSSDRDDYDSNPVIKTETKKDGSSVTENKAADGSTGTVKTDKHGQTEAKTALSNKAVEDAKKNGEAVKAPVEVKASHDSSTAPTVKVELPKGAGETKVEIPVSNVKSGTVAVLVHPDGTEEIVKNSIPTEDGIQLTVDGNATVKIIDNSKDFIDTRNHWAEDAIDFVSARGLVNGMTDTIYAPNNSATRAQLWTILARQNDADLSGGSIWYEKAQNWAKSEGVSDGANPNAAINRAQMVTMLWRTMGQPAAGGAANFNDVPANSYYAQAVAWAVENGITTGVGGGRFDPAATCTRAQIAAFLTRLYAEK